MFSRVGVPWIEPRCAVTAVTPMAAGKGTAITLAQPCWDWFVARGCASHAPYPCAHAVRSPNVGGGLHPRRIENIPELLARSDQAGRFATQRSTVFYSLANDETTIPELTTARTHALVEGAAGVTDVSFINITFEFSARGPLPDSDAGQVDVQTGYHSCFANDSRAVPGTASKGERALAGISAALHFDAPHGIFRLTGVRCDTWAALVFGWTPAASGAASLAPSFTT